MPFVKVGGYFISMKGEDVENELKEVRKGIETLGGRIIKKQLVKKFLSLI